MSNTPKLLSDMFYTSASLYLGKTAVWCENKSITYKDLACLVSKYSNFLLENGVRYKDHIAIPMTNSIESAALIFTAANLGIALAPINPTLPIMAIQKAIKASGARHIIARKAFFEEYNAFINIDGLKICLDEPYAGCLCLSDANKFSDKRPILPQITGSELLIITMTSGSTGCPKPIALTQRCKLKRATEHIELYKISNKDIVLAATPLYHSLAERLVIMPLLIGAVSVIMPRFTSMLCLNCIKDKNVTFTILVSAQLTQIAQLLSSPFLPKIDSLRCVVSSSALLEPHVKSELIDKLCCEFHEMYGTSETSTVTDINFNEAFEHKNSVGKPIAKTKLKILDENNNELKPLEVGEIACKTPLLCDGYYNMPNAFDSLLFTEYFKTGDMGYVDNNGYLYFSGRKKDIIITGGINIYPVDIENCVSQLAEIKECAAFAYPDERLGEAAALAVVLKPNCILTKRKIKTHCAKNLADFQQPRLIFFLKALPKNSMGKLVKAEIIKCIEGQQACYNRLIKV